MSNERWLTKFVNRLLFEPEFGLPFASERELWLFEFDDDERRKLVSNLDVGRVLKIILHSFMNKVHFSSHFYHLQI